MPTLKKYVASSDKTGYYILANVGGAAPVTLQTTDIAARILNRAGYKPDKAVPTKLVWSMYDVGLLHTSSSVNQNLSKLSGDPNQVLRGIDIHNILSDSERQHVISLLKGYDGPNKGQVKKLRKLLESSKGQPTKSSKAKRQGGVSYPTTAGEAVSNLFVWSDGLDHFRELKKRFDQNKRIVLTSMQVFYNHPYADFEGIEILEDGTVIYPLKGTGLGIVVKVIDKRGSKYMDYVIEFTWREGGTGTMSILNRKVEQTSGMEDRFVGRDLDELAEKLLSLEKYEIDPDHQFTDFIKMEGYSLPVVGSVEEFRKGTNRLQSEKLVEVVVDRISNNENPVVNLPTGGHGILECGSPGDRFIVRESEDTRFSPVAIIR